MKPVSPIRIKLQSSIIKALYRRATGMIQGVGIIERHYFVIPNDATLYARMQGQYFFRPKDRDIPILADSITGKTIFHAA